MVGEKEIPWCTIFLVLGAFASNCLVLIGNLDAAASFNNIGQSTGGWSNVGTSMAKSFDNELAMLMNEVTLSLSHGVADIEKVSGEIDTMLSSVGKKADASMLQLAKGASEVAVRHRTNRSLSKQLPGGLVQEAVFAEVKKDAMAEVSAVIQDEVGKANKLLQGFLTAITPSLIQIGKWEISFGSKLQNDIDQFGTTIDWVQKAFDTLMSKLKGTDPAYEEYMIYNTFNLFDPQANDCITQDGLLGAARMYGITALSGIKGEAVFAKYAGGDGCIDHDEYLSMVNDPGLNGIVTTVLRTYGEGLSRVAGTLGQARLRSAVAQSVVQYLDLVSAKNHTKVGWVCERLTNGSLPMAFTSVVLMELAFQASDPNVLSTIPVGPLVIDFLLYQNTSYTVEAFHQMSQPSFWTTEGFLTKSLPEVVHLIGGWIQEGINATKMGKNPAQEHHAQHHHESDKHKEHHDDKMASLLEVQASALAEAEAKFASGYVQQLKTSAMAEIRRQKHKDHEALIERRVNLTDSHTSKHLFRELLGGKTMSRGTLTPTEWEVLHQGVPAVPATLEFAKYLAWNCTRDSGIFLEHCMKYSSTSSNQLDAFANEIKNFVGMTQSFLTTISTYSGAKGVQFLESEIMSFVEGAEHALIHAIEPKVDAIISHVIEKAESVGEVDAADAEKLLEEVKEELESIIAGGKSAEKSLAALQLERRLPGAGEAASKAEGDASKAEGDVSKAEGDVAKAEGDVSKAEDKAKGDMLMVFEEIRTLLSDLMALLPSAVSTVNGARSEISKVAQMMTSIFATFGTLGPNIFGDISFAYSALWTVYFILLLPLTVGTLFYGCWASGWMGGPQAADLPEESEQEAARPKGFCERIGVCYSACCRCCGKCHDSMMCFWSCMIIYQIIVLVIFIVGIVLCMLNGIKLFFSASCLEIYMLDQSDMCLNVLNSVKAFITTFVVDPLIPLEDTCSQKNLLMCELIGEKMQTSMLYTTIFSFTSAIFQYQLVIESAILHERARMRRIVQGLQNK